MSVDVVGRESERSAILDFVALCEKNRSGGVMYCAGPPGTGKTLCTKNVLTEWENVKSAGCTKRWSYLNAIGLKDHLTVFSAIEALVRGSSYSSQVRKRGRTGGFQDTAEPFAQVADCVDSIESTAKLVASKSSGRNTHPVCIMVVDEIDYLCSCLSGATRGSGKSQQLVKRQVDLITNLFSLPEKLAGCGITLVIIGIANSIDLSSKLAILYKKKALINKTLLFRPYTASELKDIVLSLTGSDLDPVAVEVSARKVAAVHGDCRKVIDLCKQAKNLANQKGSVTTTTIQDLMTVMNKAYKSQSESLVSLKALPLQQLLVLVSACRFALEHRERSEFGIMDLKSAFSKLVNDLQIPAMTFGSLSAITEHVTALSHSGLMTIRASSGRTVIGRDAVQWRLNSPPETLEETLRLTHSLIANALGGQDDGVVCRE